MYLEGMIHSFMPPKLAMRHCENVATLEIAAPVEAALEMLANLWESARGYLKAPALNEGRDIRYDRGGQVFSIRVGGTPRRGGINVYFEVRECLRSPSQDLTQTLRGAIEAVVDVRHSARNSWYGLGEFALTLLEAKLRTERVYCLSHGGRLSFFDPSA